MGNYGKVYNMVRPIGEYGNAEIVLSFKNIADEWVDFGHTIIEYNWAGRVCFCSPDCHFNNGRGQVFRKHSISKVSWIDKEAMRNYEMADRYTDAESFERALFENDWL